MFLCQSASYDAPDREHRPEAEVQWLEHAAGGLQRYTEGVQAKDHPLSRFMTWAATWKCGRRVSWCTPGGLWKRSAASWPGTLLLAEPDSYEQAVECYRAVVNELRRTGNGAESIAKALHNQALADLRLGRFERAKAALRDCAALAPNGGLDQPV